MRRSWSIRRHTFRRASKHLGAVLLLLRLLVGVEVSRKLLPVVHRISLHFAGNGVDVGEVVAHEQPAPVRLVVQREHVDAAAGVLRLEDEAEGVLVADLGGLVADEGADEAARVDDEAREAPRGRAAAHADEVEEVNLVDVARRLAVQAPDKVGVEAAHRILEHAQHEVALMRLLAVVDEIRAAHEQAHRSAAVRRRFREVVAADAIETTQREGEAADHIVAIDSGQRADSGDVRRHWTGRRRPISILLRGVIRTNAR